ncbi:uncharacterized protein LOC142323753 isoform X2 [Lycorma delicatula]|uniref:uncharacterized protein LOC142323753 isoform X2 n=1 Tax=Lycorma delicatula TaxID=130591 RepID=UPI003F510D54
MISNQRSMMSHTVTVTRTTTTTSTSAIILNSGYLKTMPGLLKVLEVVGGAIALFLAVYYRDKYRYATGSPELFFIAITTAFVIGSLCLLIACLISLSTASIIAKTIYEVVFHFFGFLFYLVASLILLVDVNNSSQYKYPGHTQFLIASVIGLVLSALYLLSTIFAYKGYRGG